MDRRTVLLSLALSASILGLPVGTHATEQPREIRLDYAHYSPLSLVVRKLGWMEDEFNAGGTAVRWVPSQSSDRARFPCAARDCPRERPRTICVLLTSPSGAASFSTRGYLWRAALGAAG